MHVPGGAAEPAGADDEVDDTAGPSSAGPSTAAPAAKGGRAAADSLANRSEVTIVLPEKLQRNKVPAHGHSHTCCRRRLLRPRLLVVAQVPHRSEWGVQRIAPACRTLRALTWVAHTCGTHGSRTSHTSSRDPAVPDVARQHGCAAPLRHSLSVRPSQSVDRNRHNAAVRCPCVAFATEYLSVQCGGTRLHVLMLET
jgi:hypothetical protein